MLLKRGGVVENREELGLTDARGREESISVETEPLRSVRRAFVDNLGGNVAPGSEIDRPTVYSAIEVLPHLDTLPVRELDPHTHIPILAVPRAVTLGEFPVLPAGGAAAPSDAAERRVDRGVPRRLPCFVRSEDHRHPGGKLERCSAEGPEGMRGDSLEAHPYGTSRSVLPSNARRPVARIRRHSSGSRSLAASTSRTNCPRTVFSAAIAS